MPVPAASFGNGIGLIRQHKIVAEQGCSFWVVEAASDDWADRVVGWVWEAKPVFAQNCGHFMIKNPTESPAGRIPNRLS